MPHPRPSQIAHKANAHLPRSGSLIGKRVAISTALMLLVGMTMPTAEANNLMKNPPNNCSFATIDGTRYCHWWNAVNGTTTIDVYDQIGTPWSGEIQNTINRWNNRQYATFIKFRYNYGGPAACENPDALPGGGYQKIVVCLHTLPDAVGFWTAQYTSTTGHYRTGLVWIDPSKADFTSGYRKASTLCEELGHGFGVEHDPNWAAHPGWSTAGQDGWTCMKDLGAVDQYMPSQHDTDQIHFLYRLHGH